MLWFAWTLLWSLMLWFGDRFDLECARARARASCLCCVVGLSAPTWTTWGVPLMGTGALWRDNQQSTFAHIHTSSSHSTTSPWSPIPYPHWVSTNCATSEKTFWLTPRRARSRARETTVSGFTPSGRPDAKALGSERLRCKTTGPRRHGAAARGSRSTGSYGPRPRGHQRDLVSWSLKTRRRTPVGPRNVR